MKTMLRMSLLSMLALTIFGAAPSSGAVLQISNAELGNQAWSGVGVRFDVNAPITITSLGIYDSGLDGILASPESPLSAYLMTSSGTTLASATFDSGSQGTLDVASRYRFKSIAPLVLGTGEYVLAGYGWTNADPEHNCNISGTCDTFNTFGGRLTYLGSPFGSSVDPGGVLPTNECCGNLNFFSAANIEAAVPEPSTWAMMLIGFAGVGYLAFRKAKKREAAAVA